jgi:hypothetical protein
MANNPFWGDPAIAGASGALATICALLNGGKLHIWTGSQVGGNSGLTGTKLVTLSFNATAFGTPTASGTDGAGRLVTATAAGSPPLVSGTAAATGTAGYFVILKYDNTTVIATGSVGTTGADLNLNSLSITSGATVSCSAFAITQVE